MNYLNIFFTIFLVFFISIIDARRLIVIRHGEKISDDYLHLNNKGNARAQCLHKVFNSNTIYGRPQSIYSNKRGNRSHRPYDTVKPLADRLGLPVNEFKKSDPKKFVKETLNKDKSEIILLSSAREWIPSLVDAIGYKISEEVDDFDNIWVIENDDKKGHGKLSVKKQNLEACIKQYLANGTTDGVAINANIKKNNTSKKATTTTKKVTVKKNTTTKKTTTKKTTTKKTTTKKTTTKKTTTKKTTTKKTTTKKTTTKKTTTKKTTTKKAITKIITTKKITTKKTTTKKIITKNNVITKKTTTKKNIVTTKKNTTTKKPTVVSKTTKIIKNTKKTTNKKVSKKN